MGLLGLESLVARCLLEELLSIGEASPYSTDFGGLLLSKVYSVGVLWVLNLISLFWLHTYLVLLL